MPGMSQRVMRTRKHATRWRLKGGLTLAIIAPVIAAAAAMMPAVPALASVPGPPSGWSTVFSDDFNGSAGSGIDSQCM